MLLTTDYVICFRRERGFCQIDFSVQPSGSGGTEFTLGDTGTRTGGNIPDNEKAVYLEIAGSSSELYSGQNFADLVTAGTQQTTNGVVRGNKTGCLEKVDPEDPHCLKTTPNVSFEFFQVWHFPRISVLLKVTYLVILSDI